jgi:hypothetical protein
VWGGDVAAALLLLLEVDLLLLALVVQALVVRHEARARARRGAVDYRELHRRRDAIRSALHIRRPKSPRTALRVLPLSLSVPVPMPVLPMLPMLLVQWHGRDVLDVAVAGDAAVRGQGDGRARTGDGGRGRVDGAVQRLADVIVVPGRRGDD